MGNLDKVKISERSSQMWQRFTSAIPVPRRPRQMDHSDLVVSLGYIASARLV